MMAAIHGIIPTVLMSTQNDIFILKVVCRFHTTEIGHIANTRSTKALRADKAISKMVYFAFMSNLIVTYLLETTRSLEQLFLVHTSHDIEHSIVFP